MPPAAHTVREMNPRFATSVPLQHAILLSGVNDDFQLVQDSTIFNTNLLGEMGLMVPDSDDSDGDMMLKAAVRGSQQNQEDDFDDDCDDLAGIH